MDEVTRGTVARDIRMKTPRGPIEPVLPAQKPPSPSPAFIKENSDILRTMIKEHDQQAKTKAIPRKLAYADSDKEAPARSLVRSFSDQFSLESFDTSGTRRQTRFVGKSQRNPSKEPLHHRRSRRLESRSRTKEKTRREKSKSKGKRSEHHRTSSDSEYEEAAAEQEEWPMPIWCKMIRQTLGGAARNWFDDLDPKNVDSFEELSLQAFMDRFKFESSHIKGVPPVLSAFMHGHGHLELAKKFNDKIPKTVDEMFERVRAFISGEVFTSSVEMIKEVVASGKLAHLVKDICRNNQRNGSQGRNNVKVINMIREGENHKGPFREERSSITDELTFPAIPRNQLTDEPIILEGIIEGHQTKKKQSSDDRFFRRNIPSSGNNRPSSTYGKGRKKQNGANGVCNNKMSFAIQCHNRKDRNKKPESDVLRGSIEVFAWAGSERTSVPRFVMEHQLKIYLLAELVVHKRRPMTPDGRLEVKEKVFHWIKEGTIRI
ncbi:hypothetical protein Tco_0756337 [Tanacetum coccineum]